MLTSIDIEKLARDYLIKNNFPIVGSGCVKFPEDRNTLETREYFKKNNLAIVSFLSKYLDDPEHELDPGAYILYVDITTGEVDMPPHM